jgi:hypothetical protein
MTPSDPAKSEHISEKAKRSENLKRNEVKKVVLCFPLSMRKQSETDLVSVRFASKQKNCNKLRETGAPYCSPYMTLAAAFFEHRQELCMEGLQIFLCIGIFVCRIDSFFVIQVHIFVVFVSRLFVSIKSLDNGQVSLPESS